MNIVNNDNNGNKRGKRINLSFRIDLLILVCLLTFVTCFIVYMLTSEITAEMVNKNLTGETSESKSSDNVQNRKNVVNPVAAVEKQNESYFDDTVFIGDFLCFGLSAFNVVDYDKIVSSTELTVANVMTQTVNINGENVVAIDALKSKTPSKIYLMFGSNGIGFVPSSTLIQNYSVLLDSLTSTFDGTDIYVVSIPPVTAAREKQKNNAIHNSVVDDFNSKLLGLANNKQVHFVDFNTALKNNSGALDEKNAENDGLHLNKNAYGILKDYILTHVVE